MSEPPKQAASPNASVEQETASLEQGTPVVVEDGHPPCHGMHFYVWHPYMIPLYVALVGGVVAIIVALIKRGRKGQHQ